MDASPSPPLAAGAPPLEDWLEDPRWDELAVADTPLHLAAVPGPARAFVLAALARRKPRLLALTPGVREQEELANDLEAWGAPFWFYPQIDAGPGESPDTDQAAERLAVLDALSQDGAARPVVATVAAHDQPVPAPADLRGQRLTLLPGMETDRDAWLAQLAEAGYQPEAQVSERGAFSVRGAIVDVFSWQAQAPVRTEWMGDELESVRAFDPATQCSRGELDRAVLSLSPPTAPGTGDGASLADYLPADTRRVSFEPDGPETQAQAADLPALLEFYAHDFLHGARGDVILQEQRRALFLRHLRDWLSGGWRVAVFCNNEGERARLEEIIREDGIDPAGLQFVLRPLLRGFVWPAARRVVLSDAEIFGRYQTLRSLRRQERLASLRSGHGPLDFTDIADGDYVVHLHHGIALYCGLKSLPAAGGGTAENLELLFAEESRLYVPVEQAYLVSKYVGTGKRHPPLDTLGGSRWERAKASARKAVMDYAAQLLAVQAERDTARGHAFGTDTPWQREFEDSFLYQETADQIKAIADTKADMERSRPMDRLICGDVGFGKTEVAVRAIFKAVMDGKQAAFLVPTTVLAQQHYHHLRERFADYPIRVEVLSRFRSAKEQRAAIAGLADGSVDAVVGTHRLVSKDVVFSDLGLVVVDEEQRFGVRQKEKFKQRFRLVDVLTLSATPIPRTLYLSLTGARDLSTIETPPPNRVPVETMVAPYDERVIREAIHRELARDGQVYFLHNRVHSILNVKEKLQLLCPEARVDIGHGQMSEGELEEVMARFVAGETDVLLATTIIESGLDIPNANTILIDRADRFGLADLYQLRGRVGRAQNKAFAYLFLPKHLMAVGDARKRVSAIRQYSELGSGFKIAMRDLEIRGAGNLLGTAQSGHIGAVGFELYCQLLKTAVAQLKDGRPVSMIRTRLDLDFLSFQEGQEESSEEARAGAFIPRGYIPEGRERVEAYRRLAELGTPEEGRALQREWRDRYGRFPPPLRLLGLATDIRLRAARQNIRLVETQGEKLMLHQGKDYIMTGGRFPRLTGSDPLSKLKQILHWLSSLSHEGKT
ncbi:MAG: transcription-repair coupling factor [Verrucomicrobiota bacterium]